MTEIWEWFKALIAPLIDAVGGILPTVAAGAFVAYLVYVVLFDDSTGSKGAKKGTKKPKGGDRR